MIARTRAHWGAAAGLGALFLALVLACALRPGAASADAAAGGEARRANPHLGERDDAFMDRQAKATLDLVDEVLTACPPALEEPIERRLALYLLDNVFHDVFASERAPVVEYFQSAMARTVENIERTKVRKGAVVWKLWNHAFVVRTKSVTLGFDVIQRCGMGDMAISDELLERLVSECDVLFVSHE
ncbi:MAG: hypothetical protein JXR94_03790, partial [Candidatus Hydrogenedentes bacterium]|nr:hypothetical protein [Candidatus Hydrogenedentota bacterium]